MSVYIYALADPYTDDIKYIGKTKNLTQRIISHKYDKGNKEKYEWISSLKRRGKSPIVKVIEECSEDEWERREVFHIEKARKEGLNIFNVSNGGRGRIPKRISPNGFVRFHMFLDHKLIDQLKEEMASYGFATIGSFIRFIVVDFFKNKDKIK